MAPRVRTPPFTHTLDLAAQTERDDDPFLKLPATPGVALFCDSAGAAVQLLQTANLRRLARSRLDLQHITDERQSLVGACARVCCLSVWSASLVELAWAALARTHAPRLLASSRERAWAWFLRYDTRERYPKAVPVDARQLAAAQGDAKPDALGGYFGPYLTRKAAQHAGEAITDAFDLCRHHHLLVLEPAASPCAYKDMGRCPAACDGSETMEAYHTRAREAASWLSDPHAAMGRGREEMEQAAQLLDFEKAAARKTIIERASALLHASAEHARALASRCALVLLPSGDPQREWVTLMGFHAGAVEHLGSVRSDIGEEALVALACAGPANGAAGVSERADGFVWLADQLYRPENKRTGRGACVVVETPADPTDTIALRGALAEVCQQARSAPADTRPGADALAAPIPPPKTDQKTDQKPAP